MPESLGREPNRALNNRDVRIPQEAVLWTFFGDAAANLGYVRRWKSPHIAGMSPTRINRSLRVRRVERRKASAGSYERAMDPHNVDFRFALLTATNLGGQAGAAQGKAEFRLASTAGQYRGRLGRHERQPVCLYFRYQ